MALNLDQLDLRKFIWWLKMVEPGFLKIEMVLSAIHEFLTETDFVFCEVDQKELVVLGQDFD